MNQTNRPSPSKVKESTAWFEASDVIPMFPTLVWKIVLKAQLREVIDAKILATLESLRRDLPTLEPYHGWQSKQTLHLRNEFQELISCVNKATKIILQFLRIDEERFEITGC